MLIIVGTMVEIPIWPACLRVTGPIPGMDRASLHSVLPILTALRRAPPFHVWEPAGPDMIEQVLDVLAVFHPGDFHFEPIAISGPRCIQGRAEIQIDHRRQVERLRPPLLHKPFQTLEAPNLQSGVESSQMVLSLFPSNSRRRLVSGISFPASSARPMEIFCPVFST